MLGDHPSRSAKCALAYIQLHIVHCLYYFVFEKLFLSIKLVSIIKAQWSKPKKCVYHLLLYTGIRYTVYQARIQGKAYRAYGPQKFSKIRVLVVIYIHLYNDKCAHISVNYLPVFHQRFCFYHADSACSIAVFFRGC